MSCLLPCHPTQGGEAQEREKPGDYKPNKQAKRTSFVNPAQEDAWGSSEVCFGAVADRQVLSLQGRAWEGPHHT